MINRWFSAAFTVIALAIFFLAMLIVYGHGMASFPPLSYLASELGVAEGQPLPKGVIWNGRPYFFYITSAQEHPNGRYTVELKAR